MAEGARRHRGRGRPGPHSAASQSKHPHPSTVRRLGDLEIDEDLQIERVTWKLQKIGWIAMLLFVAAGLAGLLGHGPLSAATAGRGGPLEVRYQRFERLQAPTSIEVLLRSRPIQPGALRLWVNAPWLDAFEVHGIAPPPDRQSVTRDRAWLVYDRAPEAIRLHLEPKRFGLLRARFGFDRDTAVELTQLVYP
jgi:hypothetical protein